MINEYLGKKCKHCYAMGGRINFQSNGVSLCHSLEGEDPYIEFAYGEDLAESYVKSVKNLLDKLNYGDSSGGCACCSMLTDDVFDADKIYIITVNTSTKCNARCLYCCSHNGESGRPTSIVPYIQQLENRNYLSKDCFFDYGGGESTLDPYFEENIRYIANKNYMLRVNTNAFEYSKLLSDLIKEHGDYYVRISVDAGTPETYRRIKGADKYFDVWNNIVRYKDSSSNVMIKYVLCGINCKQTDVEGFVNQCKKVGAEELYIDVDHDAYAIPNNTGWSVYSKDILDSAWHMKRYAESKGIVARIGYVWTARNVDQQTYDYNIVRRDARGIRYLTSVNEIRLPDRFEDNTEELRKCYKFVYKKFNDLENLLANIDVQRMVLYGAGKNGNRLLEKLESKGIKPVGISDSNVNIYENKWNGYDIKSLKKLHQEYGDIDVILTPAVADEILRYFNISAEYEFLKDHLYYISGQDY